MNPVYIKEYGDFLKKDLKLRRPIKVVFDCSNGYAGEVLKETLKGVPNIKPVYLNAKPDGNFSGRGPNPSNPGALDGLKREVVMKKADLGVAFDGDADRVIFVDDKGAEIDSDDFLRFYIDEMSPKSIVVDFRIGWAVRETEDIKIFRTKVGNYYIKEAMIKNGVSFGAERTGHYYFKIKGAYIDGAIKMALIVASIISKKRDPLSKIIGSYQDNYFRISEKNYPVKDKQAAIQAIRKAYIRRRPQVIEIDGLTLELKDFWMNVRPSADEDLLRLNLEARSEAVLQKELKVIESLIKSV